MFSVFSVCVCIGMAWVSEPTSISRFGWHGSAADDTAVTLSVRQETQPRELSCPRQVAEWSQIKTVSVSGRCPPATRILVVYDCPPDTHHANSRQLTFLHTASAIGATHHNGRCSPLPAYTHARTRARY